MQAIPRRLPSSVRNRMMENDYNEVRGNAKNLNALAEQIYKVSRSRIKLELQLERQAELTKIRKMKSIQEWSYYLENIISPLEKRSSHVRFNTAVVGFNKDGARRRARRRAECKVQARRKTSINGKLPLFGWLWNWHTRNHFSPAHILWKNCRTCVELVVELVVFYVELVVLRRKGWNR